MLGWQSGPLQSFEGSHHGDRQSHSLRSGEAVIFVAGKAVRCGMSRQLLWWSATRSAAVVPLTCCFAYPA